MGLISEEIEIGLKGNKKISYYREKGYIIPTKKDMQNREVIDYSKIILVNIKDLTNNCTALVNVQCDNCKEIKQLKYRDYNKYLKNNNGLYYCKKCAINIIGKEKSIKTKLKEGKSFQQWCIENNRQDVLDRWDYELNDYKPNEIGYCVGRKFYFKCPKHIHKSELKKIADFSSGSNGVMDCKYCNSFAQWGIDNICEDFLEKYWDYEKNTVDPWIIAKCSGTKIWIKCQEKDYHGSYKVICASFKNGSRCLYCCNFHGKVHPLDSLGALYPEVLNVWSDKNKKSPYQYAPMSNQEVYWKCLNMKHKDFKRSIQSSNNYNFRCSECSDYSKGEERISNYFINKNINYIPQKTFNGLIGLGNRLLSYDFYLHDYNLLIEYQGEFHDGRVSNQTEIQLKRQQEHDRRKREYASENRYKLLEVWYWNYDNIEQILDDYLNKLNINKSA